MEIYHDQKNEVAWSSWLPALGYALGASTGPVLEIGVGHFSTPFLHEYCDGAKRKLWSIEADDVWRNEFNSRYASESHRFGYPSMIQMTVDCPHFGVTFIDNSPGGEGRARWFRLYAPISDFVVVHDYWKDNMEAIDPLLPGRPYRLFTDYEPPTLLSIKNWGVLNFKEGKP